MAKTVAEIDGDSSGLVKELDQAKKAMGKLEDGGKKLSDQLKDVADQADTAAGNLINKIGGPNAIKAIAGVGAGFAIAQQGVQLFLDSSEKLFRSYGNEGQAVWDNLEKELNSLNGSFAKTVLQTDDMYVASGRLYAGLQLVKDMTNQVVDTVISGFNLISKVPGFGIIPRKLGFYEAFENFAKEGEAQSREIVQNMEKVTKATERTATPVKTLTETVDAMATAYAGLTNSSVSLQDQQRAAALENIDNTVKQVEALALLQNMADNMSGDNVGGLTDKQFEDLDRLGKLRQQIVEGGKTPAAAAATGGGGGGETAAQKAKREAAEKEAARQEQFAKDIAIQEARDALYGQSRDSEIAAYEEAAKAKQAADQEVFNAARALAIQQADLTFDLTQTPAEYVADVAEKAAADQAKAEADKALKQTEYDARVALYGDASTAEIDAYKATKEAKAAADQAEFDAARQRAIELNDLTFDLAQSASEFVANERAKEADSTLNRMKARAGEEMGIYMKNAGQQIAIGKLSAKAAADMARSQLGNVIIGLGDKAMAEAGIMAAGLNPLAIPMAAAGLAAYAVGNAMMPTVKAAAGTTPATEKVESAQAPSNNYSFNMRVDSVFADGESVARQFALMQESARQRGLLSQGAY